MWGASQKRYGTEMKCLFIVFYSGIAELKISQLKVSLPLVLQIRTIQAAVFVTAEIFRWEESNVVFVTNFKAWKGQKLNESCLNSHRRGRSPTC